MSIDKNKQQNQNQEQDQENMRLKALIEAALFVSEKPLTIESLQQLLAHQQPQEPIQGPIQEQALLLSKAEIRVIVNDLIADYQQRGIELVKVASGYRFQAKAKFSQALTAILQEKAPKYSRAFLETLALIAYKQPITRAEIEAIRGVSVSSHIMKTLVEHHWIKNLGQKEVPGRPSLYGTTKVFLDHFSLSSLAELPVLTKLDEKQLS